MSRISVSRQTKEAIDILVPIEGLSDPASEQYQAGTDRLQELVEDENVLLGLEDICNPT